MATKICFATLAIAVDAQFDDLFKYEAKFRSTFLTGSFEEGLFSHNLDAGGPMLVGAETMAAQQAGDSHPVGFHEAYVHGKEAVDLPNAKVHLMAAVSDVGAAGAASGIWAALTIDGQTKQASISGHAHIARLDGLDEAPEASASFCANIAIDDGNFQLNQVLETYHQMEPMMEAQGKAMLQQILNPVTIDGAPAVGACVTPPAGAPFGPPEGGEDDPFNGEKVCEQHGFGPGTCESAGMEPPHVQGPISNWQGCCQFDYGNGQCWSAVGRADCYHPDRESTSPMGEHQVCFYFGNQNGTYTPGGYGVLLTSEDRAHMTLDFPDWGAVQDMQIIGMKYSDFSTEPSFPLASCYQSPPEMLAAASYEQRRALHVALKVLEFHVNNFRQRGPAERALLDIVPQRFVSNLLEKPAKSSSSKDSYMQTAVVAAAFGAGALMALAVLRRKKDDDDGSKYFAA